MYKAFYPLFFFFFSKGKLKVCKFGFLCMGFFCFLQLLSWVGLGGCYTHIIYVFMLALHKNLKIFLKTLFASWNIKEANHRKFMLLNYEIVKCYS